MALSRLLSRPDPRSARTHVGRCALCGEPVRTGERFVRMFGEVFHSECAFYRGRSSDGRPR